MLPVYLSEEVEYATEGILSFAPLFARVLTVFDGEALISDTIHDPDWDTVEPRRELINRIRSSFSEGLLKDYSPAIVPFAFPPTESSPGQWKGLLIDMGYAKNSVYMKKSDDRQEMFRNYAQHFAQKLQEHIGVECAGLTGTAEYGAVADYFSKAIDDDPRIFDRTAKLISPPRLISPALHGILKITAPALRSSHLRRTLLDGISWKGEEASPEGPLVPKI